MSAFGPYIPVILDDNTDANIGEGFWYTHPQRGLDNEVTAAILVAHGINP